MRLTPPLAILVAGTVVLVIVLFLFDSHLLAERCDHQVQTLTAEKQQAAKHVKALQQALAESAETLENMRRRASTVSEEHLASSLRQLDALGARRASSRRSRAGQPTPHPATPTAPPAEKQGQVASDHADRLTLPGSAEDGREPSELSPTRIAVVVIAYNRPRRQETGPSLACHRSSPPPVPALGAQLSRPRAEIGVSSTPWRESVSRLCLWCRSRGWPLVVVDERRGPARVRRRNLYALLRGVDARPHSWPGASRVCPCRPGVARRRERRSPERDCQVGGRATRARLRC